MRTPHTPANPTTSDGIDPLPTGPSVPIRSRGSRPSRLVSLARLAAVAVGACAPADDAAETDAVPRDSAHLYADRVLESLGGEEAWEDTRFLSFRWVVAREGDVVSDRRHAWDRYDGRYRLEYTADGAPHVALFNEKEIRQDPTLGKIPSGRVWRDGVELGSPVADSALAGAYATFINDTYWLLMPLKWEDPGVHLAYEGTRTLSDGRAYAVVHLTFDQGLGVTEDQYWAFVDPETGRMAAWQYHLGRSAEPGSVIWWDQWTPLGNLTMPLRRRNEEGDLVIRFEDVVAAHEVPDSVFVPPMP